MAFSVGGWDYRRFGDNPSDTIAGFGYADIDEAIKAGASPFQIRQLYQRAKKEGVHRGPLAQTIETAGGGDAWDPRLKQRFQEKWPGITGIAEQSKISGGGFNFGDYGQWGFGKKDLAQITAGHPEEAIQYDTSKIDRVQRLSDWATEQGIGVGHEVPTWLSLTKSKKEHEDQLSAASEQIDALNDRIQNQVAQEMPVVEPPKPKFRGAGGHFVPGTARVQGYKIPKASRSRSLAGRFGRTGAGFQSALAIASGNQGATQSKVLNI